MRWVGPAIGSIACAMIACDRAPAPEPVQAPAQPPVTATAPGAPDPMLPVGIAAPTAPDPTAPDPTAPDPTAPDPTAPDPVVAPAPVDRRATWIAEGFRCRAISTTRLRRCAMEASESGEVSIDFPIADLHCDRVLFDDAGDPERLEGCRSSWLGVPQTIALTRRGDTWSGSHSGWSWSTRGGGDSYCCPGVWMLAPESLREGSALEPIDADHDVPPPKPPRRT